MSTSAGRPHRGRRDNGLDAPEFVALADVDPRIGEHLLDVLGLVGIAAYLTPSADLNPVVRATTLPARPTDRLWVDRERLDEARGLLEAVQEDDAANAAPATRPSTATRHLEVDVDAEWERIVAGYEATAAPDRPRRRVGEVTPAAEEAEPDDTTADVSVDPLPIRRPGSTDPVTPSVTDATPPEQTDEIEAVAAPAATGPGTEQGPETAVAEQPAETEPKKPVDPAPGGLMGPLTSVNRLSPVGPVGRDRLTGTDAPPSDFDLEDSDEGYDPPPPPPLPRISFPLVLAVLAIGAGMILLFRDDTLGLSEQARLLLALCGIVGGAGALVWRLRDGWSDDDDGDDGAVV